MKPHHPYVEEAWQADLALEASGLVLTCPDCQGTGWFHPVAAPLPDARERHYRACKRCGFWQEADGTDAYRTWKSIHICVSRPTAPFNCAFCDTTITPEASTGVATHQCGKYLRPTEGGYLCTTCGVWQGRETLTPWPVLGSG